MKVVLIGPPGAGKGTQGERLAQKQGIPRISSGDLFRDHQRRDSDLGKLARSYMERGVLVSDEVTIKMVKEWIQENSDDGGFILDGFPRTFAQAEALNSELADQGGIDKVLYIKVTEEELNRRLLGRLVCRSCQTPYQVDSAPPRERGRCDGCGSELYQRPDDKPEAVAKRLRVYMEETEPLISYYRKAGVLTEINGEAPIEKVAEALGNELQN